MIELYERPIDEIIKNAMNYIADSDMSPDDRTMMFGYITALSWRYYRDVQKGDRGE